MGITNDPKVKAVKINECGEELVKIPANEFELEPLYFEWGFTDEKEMFLREGVVEKLSKAQSFLRSKEGYEKHKLKIWDGFRTLKTQARLFDAYYKELREEHEDWSDEQVKESVQIFVSFPSHDPSCPAPHNTGAAVDLTIIDGDGKELDFGTPFDEFTERAYTDHFANSDEENAAKIHNNRELLIEIMEEAGFLNYPEEWWHFSFGDQAWAAAKNLNEAIYGSKEL